jgi:hypothetical protein
MITQSHEGISHLVADALAPPLPPPKTGRHTIYGDG